MIRTRIAPSPTGYLHIGTARTALFNYLFARQNNGEFLLRIEDTDSERNTTQAMDSIFSGLKWLGLNWDGDVVIQSSRFENHKKYVQKLLDAGLAYYSYISPEEIQRRRDDSIANGTRYIHRYSKEDENGNGPAAIRFKVPHNHDVINHDIVQGDVVINSDTIEDFVILRADGTPVYMLSVVCDDIDMEITHVIRGDDHLTNTAKQILLYRAIGAELPKFAHIPLIHGMDGKKLSKRHGALAVEEYREMGYLPEALQAYLLRLGWGSSSDEILDQNSAIKEFSLEGIGRAPSRFDFDKLLSINAHFIQQKTSKEICDIIGNLTEMQKRAVEVIKHRYKNLNDLKQALQYFSDDFTVNQELDFDVLSVVAKFLDSIENLDDFDVKFKNMLRDLDLKMSDVAPIVRMALIGKTDSIAISDIIKILGLQEARRRLQKFYQK